MKIGFITLGRVRHQRELRHAQNISANVFNARFPHLFRIIRIIENPQR